MDSGGGGGAAAEVKKERGRGGVGGRVERFGLSYFN